MITASPPRRAPAILRRRTRGGQNPPLRGRFELGGKDRGIRFKWRFEFGPSVCAVCSLTLVKLLTANAEIAEPPLTHVRGRINIAKVDNDRFAQRLFDAGKVERPKRIPLCHDHERGGAFGAKIGVLTKGNTGQDLPGLLNRLRIIGAYFRPGRLSTIVSRAAKAPPNGSASSPASTSAASPAKALT